MMIYNNTYCYLIRNSRDQYYKIQLDDTSTLQIDYLSEAHRASDKLKLENVLDYSVDIDDNDKLHLLYINTDGEMYYSIYPYVNSGKRLTQINLKNHKIKFITIKIIAQDVHIFYLLNNNLNATWSIYHNLWHNNSWSTKKVVEVTAAKYLYPYMIDYTDAYLYLFYSKDSSFSYNIKKFSLDFFIWGDLDADIELPKSHNAAFMINSNNLAFICYNKSINKNIYTLIKYKDLNNSNSKWSNETTLSEASVNALHPSVINKNNYTYVLWEEGLNLVYKKTPSNSIAWSDKKSLTVKDFSIINCIYLSKHPQDNNYKNTFSPLIEGSPPYPVINLEKGEKKHLLIKAEHHEKPYSPIESSLIDTPIKDSYIRQLQIILIDKDKKIFQLAKEIEDLKIQMLNLQKQLTEKTKELHKIRSNRADEKNMILASIKDYENTVKSLNQIMTDCNIHYNETINLLQDNLGKINSSKISEI